MSPLRALTIRSALVAVGLVLGLGLLGGVVRLLPWLLSPSIGWGPSLPFARALLVTAFEAALLMGAPVGIAVGAALFVERGEYRALAALGARPSQVLSSLALPIASLLLLSAASAMLSDPAAPGRFARDLVLGARSGCEESGETQRDVPLLGVSWLCLEPAPRFVGRVPGVRDTWFSAASVNITDDLRAAELGDLRVAGRARGRDVAVRVGRARITGLPGWGSAKRLEGVRRGAVFGVVAAVLSLFGAFSVLTRATGPLPSAFAALFGSAVALQALHFLDARREFGWVYLLVPVLAALAFRGAQWVAAELGMRAERARIARAASE